MAWGQTSSPELRRSALMAGSLGTAANLAGSALLFSGLSPAAGVAGLAISGVAGAYLFSRLD